MPFNLSWNQGLLLTALVPELAKIQSVMCNWPQGSRNRLIVGTTICCSLVILGVVVTRLLSRVMVSRKLWTDDWIILAAWVSEWGTICSESNEERLKFLTYFLLAG